MNGRVEITGRMPAQKAGPCKGWFLRGADVLPGTAILGRGKGKGSFMVGTRRRYKGEYEKES